MLSFGSRASGRLIAATVLAGCACAPRRTSPASDSPAQVAEAAKQSTFFWPVGSLVRLSIGAELCVEPGQLPHDRVAGGPAIVLAVESRNREGEPWFRILDASGKVGWIKGRLPGLKGEWVMARDTREPVVLLESSQELALNTAADQGQSSALHPLHTPQVRVHSSQGDAWISLLDLSLASPPRLDGPTPPAGLVRADFGLLDESSFGSLAPVPGSTVTLLTPFDESPSRSLALTGAFGCQRARSAYFSPRWADPGRVSARPDLSVLACTDSGGEFESFDLLVVRGASSSRGFVIQPETSLRIVRIEEQERSKGEVDLLVEVGSRSSDAYLMGLLVLSPSLSSGFHYFPFPDEGGPTTWALGTSKSPGDFFLATSATRYEPFHIKHYKRHATSYQEAPAFIALNGSSSSLLLSQQRAFPRKGAMVIAVNGEKGWMLGYPFEHEQDACAQSPLGMVIGDGDSMVTDVAAPRCASAK